MIFNNFKKKKLFLNKNFMKVNMNLIMYFVKNNFINLELSIIYHSMGLEKKLKK